MQLMAMQEKQILARATMHFSEIIKQRLIISKKL